MEPEQKSAEPNSDIESPVSEPEKKIPVQNESHWQRFKNWYKTNKKKSIPLTVLALVILLGLIPWSRYHATGLILKKDFTIQVLDSSADVPVSEVLVSLGTNSGTTDADGRVTLHNIKVGSHTFFINKKYYQTKATNLLVPILGQKSTSAVSFVATGRQVKIIVSNLITKRKLENVGIKVADIEAKTDKTGSALVVLPVGSKSSKAKLSLEGYNDGEFTVAVSDQIIKENNFKLTPAGKAYFISKRTGKLNVMKANLDGSQAEVIVAATGYEQSSSTALMQTGDGKYVALIAKRSSGNPAQLYVISAEDDRLLLVDGGRADFYLVGWSGDSLIYTVQRHDIADWQAGAHKLKAYDATTGKITLLDQTAAGDPVFDITENYGLTMLIGDKVVFSKDWPGDLPEDTDKQNTAHIIDVRGSNHKAWGNFKALDYVSYSRHSPDGIYVDDQTVDGDEIFFDYTVGGSLKKIKLSGNEFYDGNYNYYFSPDGTKSFWAESRDGKSALIITDELGNNPKTIANLSDYEAYGWFTDKYLLVTKDSTMLYVMDANGGQPIKITDFEPTYQGY